MTVYGIVGDIGCGKTLLMTYLGYQCYLDGYTVYANYNLKFPYIPIDQIKDIDFMQTFPNIVLIDEAWITADSRKASTYKNIALSKSVLQSRKQRADLIYTTQYANQIDLRIRQITKEFIIPEIMYWTQNDVPAIIKAEYFEAVNSFKFKEKGTRLFDIYNTHLLYDTNQVIEETESENYDNLLIKYKGFEGTRKELVAVLMIDDGLVKSIASTVSDYIMYMNEKLSQGVDIEDVDFDEGLVNDKSEVSSLEKFGPLMKSLSEGKLLINYLPDEITTKNKNKVKSIADEILYKEGDLNG